MGITLDRYAVLDLGALQKIVDAVGGVEVELDEPLSYSDPDAGLRIELPAGHVHLDGKRAEQLIRYRSGYANADLGRLDAQKRFMQAFFGRCCELGATELLRVTPIIFRNVETNMELSSALRLAGLLHSMGDAELPMATLAGTAVQGTSGAWYYVLNRAAACKMINEYCFTDLNEADFDPDGVFDREGHTDFHKLYTAPDTLERG
jgi:anionic cell wall polymer biosynthesis LytR-Cps2A-Psr (LCP) family protein